MQKLYYRDDADITLDFGTNDFTGVTLGNDNAFIILEFFTTDPARPYMARYDFGHGGVDHCVNIINPGQSSNGIALRVRLHDHGLQPGPLRIRRTVSVPEGDGAHVTVDYVETDIVLSSGLDTMLSRMTSPAPVRRTTHTPVMSFTLADDDDPGEQDLAVVDIPLPSPGTLTAVGYAYGAAAADIWGEFDIDTISEGDTEI